MQPPANAPPSGPDERDTGVSDTFDALMRGGELLRRRWLIVVLTATVCVAAMALVVSILRPYWRASATLVLNRTGPQVLDKVEEITPEDEISAYTQYYETQRAIISSRAVVAAALDTLGLAADPVFLDIDRIEDDMRRAEKAREIDPVERLQELISVTEVSNSRVVRVSAEYPDPEVAAEIANSVTEAYLAYINVSRSDTGERAKIDLAQEREKAKGILADADKALEAFKDQHKITSISLQDRQNIISQNISTLSSRSKRAQAERFELEAKYKQAKRLNEASSLAGAAALLSAGERVVFDRMLAERMEAEREFAQLDVKYGNKHPEWLKANRRLELINERIQEESNELLATLEARYLAALETERQLQGAVEAERNRALQLSRMEPEYRALEREAENAAETYRVLSRRDTEIGLTNRVQNRAPVEILDRATVPLEPVRPRRVLLLILAVLGGIGLGSAFAVAVDLRDHRVRSVADLERVLADYGLPVLGQLPMLPADPQLGVGNIRAQRRQRDLYTFRFPKSLMAERVRTVRTAITFNLGSDGCRVLLVSSPGAADGKSSTAMNLALSFCQAGKRVALIDADMRRPRLDHVFPPPVEYEGIGLAKVLSGEIDLDSALQRDIEGAPTNLAVLGCGAPPQNPAELLESPSCRRLMEGLRERFDVVVLDSPPVLPVTDPSILASQVDGVILVARCDGTSRVDIQRVLSNLRQGDTNILGMVLNQVDARRERGRYGSEYYTYGAQQQPAEQTS